MDKDIFITIFTPTFNRAYVIENLYLSLVKQTNKSFEWLIIDDGSTDNTKEIVDKFKRENKINIRYVYKKNEGKYKAINNAIDLANGELFFIVDSDDTLISTAIDVIKEYYIQIENKDDFIGVVGLRGNSDLKAYTGYLNEKDSYNKFYNLEYIDATFIEYRYKYKISGDRAEVCVTNKLKRFKFPENTEKFMSEGYLWNETSIKKMKFRYFNKVIYITEYLEDGLSSNMKKNLEKSPINTTMSKNQIVGIKNIPIIKRFRACIRIL